MDIRRIRTVFTGVAGSPYYNNLWFRADAASDHDNRLEVRDFWTSIAFVMTTQIRWTVEPESVTVNDETGQVILSENDTGAVYTGLGQDAGNPLPFATQGLLRLRTASYVAGREVRGKVFIPGMTESMTTTGDMTATAMNQIQVAGDNLAAATDDWQVYSPTHNTSRSVDATSVWSKFAVLRSRRD